MSDKINEVETVSCNKVKYNQCYHDGLYIVDIFLVNLGNFSHLKLGLSREPWGSPSKSYSIRYIHKY